jgi:hypothetical protein
MIFNRRLFGMRLVICCLYLFLQSCGTRAISVQELVPLSEEDICSVAVLPFTNVSNYRDGGVLLNRIFTVELARKQEFQLSQEGDIRVAYRQVRVNPYLSRPTFEKLRIIGDYLDVDVYIVGHIIEMGEKTVQGKNIPYMTVSLELINAGAGKSILKIHHSRSGDDYLKVMHFGIVTTMTELSHLVSEEIIEEMILKGFIAKCSS